MEDNRQNKGKVPLRTKIINVLATFLKSAIVGMLFAILCFIYDVYRDKEQDKKLEESVSKLAKIEQSLSTRYLGIFPEYISEIGNLFDNIDPADTIIIFEDVLYYGIKSRPVEFRKFNEQLLRHALSGGHITIAYYDVEKDPTKPSTTNIFHKMIIESRISGKYLNVMDEERRGEFRKLREKQMLGKPGVTAKIDSTLCEKYFAMTRRDNPTKFKKDIDVYLNDELIRGSAVDSTTTTYKQIVHDMCMEIDAVKHFYIDKDPNTVTFADYENMYRAMGQKIVDCYVKNGINLVPLDEYLTMSCWLVKSRHNNNGIKAILAFPSKYSTDEIGFYSQDEAFATYITTMLDGVINNNKSRKEI